LFTELDYEFIESPIVGAYEEVLELLNSSFIMGSEDEENEINLLSLTVDTEFGDNPGNEFNTISDIFELPLEFERWLKFDVGDLAHEITGLDSTDIGELYPSFDITIPIKSF
jgi:hypothetical protein